MAWGIPYYYGPLPVHVPPVRHSAKKVTARIVGLPELHVRAALLSPSSSVLSSMSNPLEGPSGALPLNDQVRWFIAISSILSILGTCFIISSFVLFRDSRKCGRRLLFMLSLSDFGLAVTWLFGAVVNLHTKGISNACVAQGYAMEFFRLSSFMWTGCFAVHLYQIIWKNVKDPEVFELRYHLVSWGLPSLVCLYFVIKDETGIQMMGQSDRPWCWIRDFKDNEWNAFGAHLQYAMFYGPLLAIFAFNLFIYSFLGRKVGELMQTRMKVRIQKRLLLYLLVFQLTSIWGLANRIYQAWNKQHHYSYFLLCMDSAFGPLQGFLNALVYGLNQKLRDRYREWLCPESQGCCGCGGERYEVVPRTEGELSSILKGKDPDLAGQQGQV